MLRRVEPNLVAVWVALQTSSTVKLGLWENRIAAADAKDANIWFRTPHGAKTVRLGDKLHVVVVTAQLPEGKTLQPEKLYSYDLEITADNQTAKQTLGTLNLLKDDPVNTNPDGDNVRHLALGYETGFLPCLVLPPKELTDLKIVHGSCRDTDNPFPDGLAWLDDLLSAGQAYLSPAKRPHQLFMTGDQIYADEVPRPLLKMLNETAQLLLGKTVEQLPFTDRSSSPPAVATAPATLVNFPVGRRNNLILNEGGMTTTNGENHLLSFGEFCAMYLYVWSNVCWPDALATAMPAAADLPPAGANDQIAPPALRDVITKNPNIPSDQLFHDYGDPDPKAPVYANDVANLIEFHRTLPKVRRALANVPSYTIFDDHEISDDWFLNPSWRDRVLGSPLGSAVVRNGMLAYALFQGWGNDPLKFQPRTGQPQQPHEELLAKAAAFVPPGAATPTTAPDPAAAKRVEQLLGLDLRNAIASDGSYAETNPPLKWFYTVPGVQHQVLVLDCRTRRAYASRVSPPGNIGLTAQAEQIPDKPSPADRKVWLVVASLPVLGPPIFDALLAPLLFRVFDFADGSLRKDLEANRGTNRVPGTNPDAIEAWAFDSKLQEALLKRLAPYSPVLLLSGDVHYSATDAMNYWTGSEPASARIVQFTSSGIKNVMPITVVQASRTLALAQKMIRSNIGAERLAWTDKSPSPVTLPASADVPSRLLSVLARSPVLAPTIGWPAGTVAARAPDWAWRVTPIRDTRADKDRPKMAQPASLFPEDASRADQDIADTNMEGYARVAERHGRELERLANSRQILFGSSIALITFQKRTEAGSDVIYAVQDLYTVQRDPSDLVARPKPLVYTRHEVALKDGAAVKPNFPVAPTGAGK
jgi:hypothetical protein